MRALLSDFGHLLPSSIRKVLEAAEAGGWDLNEPGMTVSLRLAKPGDELAAPVYATWSVGRTASGKPSYRFFSSSTASLHPLRPADIAEYLADPTTVYMTDEEAEAKDAEMDLKSRPAWDDGLPPETNVANALGARPAVVEVIVDGRSPKSRKTAAEIIAESRKKQEGQRSAPSAVPAASALLASLRSRRSS